MTKKEWPYDQQFSDWWNEGVDGEDNPYNKDTPAYWAWEGWLAGRAAEREACAKMCEAIEDDEFYWGRQYADAIRARGQE
jgi:hypothetical protein